MAGMKLRLPRGGVIKRLAHAFSMAGRERSGRETSPTGCVRNTQAARKGSVGVEGEYSYTPA